MKNQVLQNTKKSKVGLIIGLSALGLLVIGGVVVYSRLSKKKEQKPAEKKSDKPSKAPESKSDLSPEKAEIQEQRKRAIERRQFAEDYRKNQEFVDESKLTDNAKALKQRLKEQNQ